MSDLELRVAGKRVETPDGWHASWVDAAQGIVRLTDGRRSLMAVVEGSDGAWVVTIRGRRIPVSVLTWRERVLAEAETAGGAHGGPIDVTATLPGLVVAVRAAVGQEVDEGEPLLTIEAMKMQNEVRAPRGGRVVAIAVAAGEAVATGALLLRLE